MNETTALHTAARRYCAQQHRYWCERYAKLQKGREFRVPYTYNNNDLDTFPRYNVLAAILIEIERFVPEDFGSIEEAVQLLREAGETAQAPFTQRSIGEIELAAMNEERARFVSYIEELSCNDLAEVKPLPFRRTLGPEEANGLWQRLRDIWEIDGYWYPLAESQRPDIEAFQDRSFLKPSVIAIVKRALKARGIVRLFELREGDPNVELEVDSLFPSYDGREGYWFAEELDWLLYASHESSITVGGWLLSEIQDHWLDWRERVWTTPFFS